jgi:hypothetical protein
VYSPKSDTFKQHYNGNHFVAVSTYLSPTLPIASQLDEKKKALEIKE